MNKKTGTLLDNAVIYGGYIAVIVTAVVFAACTTKFLSVENIINIFAQSSVLGVVACGMTVILIGGGTHVIKGGIDLSLASNMAFGAAVAAVVTQGGGNLWIAFLTGMAISVLIGLINAAAVTKLQVTPLLVTLSMMYILDGLTIAITKNSVVSIQTGFLNTIANESFLGIPVMVWIFILVAAVLYFVCNKTRYGNRLYATGGNPTAARTAGINVTKMVMSTYIIAGMTAAISGVLVNARLSGSVPGTAGTMFLDIMLIAYMSAIFSKRAIPNILGAVISAVFVGMLSNGFTLMGVQSYYVYAIKGLLILLSVSLTSFRTKGVA